MSGIESGPIHTTAELARMAAQWYDQIKPVDPGDRPAALLGWKGPESLALVLLPEFDEKSVLPGLVQVLKAQSFGKVALCLDHWGYPPDVQAELRKVRQAMATYQNDLDPSLVMNLFAQQVGDPEDRNDRVKITTVIAIGNAPDDQPWLVGKIRSGDTIEADRPYDSPRFMQMLVGFLAS